MKKTKLKAGDILAIPDGWEVTISDKSVEVTHPNYTGSSYRRYCFAEFIIAASTEADKNDQS